MRTAPPIRLAPPRAVVGALALAALLSGCGAQSEVLVFNFRIVQFPDVAAADAYELQIRQGRAQIEDQLVSPCNFTASFAVVPEPQLEALAPQGPEYERMRVTVPTAVNLSTGNAPACPAVSTFELGINGPIRLGVDTSRGFTRIAFAGGEAFTYEDLFGARVSHFTPGFGTGRGAADFRAVLRPAHDSPRMIFVIGAFDLRQP